MAHKFAETMFTPAVQRLQEKYGSRSQYAKVEKFGGPNDRLGDDEKDFLESRDSLYLATVSETGWPYVQFRGGPAGFLKVLDDRTIGYADFRGNLQYISMGNLGHDGRVALIAMDYPSQTRLKILGKARIIEAGEEPELIQKLRVEGYQAKIERAIVMEVAAFDWNCPQHITQRFTQEEIEKAMEPMRERLVKLEEENKKLRTSLDVTRP